MKEYLFAYGLLKKEYASNPKYKVPKMAVKYIGEGFITGHLYMVAHYPGFIFNSNAETTIIGDVYEVENTELLYEMDQYECALPLYNGPHEYIRRKRAVSINHSILDCWVYEYDLPTEELTIIKSGKF
ncbi:MAG: gamma-glutamylcyclotransferase (GGCT)/AIG2-like uncharacterized protein YtfP [Cyclobacteriaceae bacterium]|jgi:gamma-glutamylcyclotransferase (GGCT)/AIG2-like uncharacterized protein YtfP